MFPDESLHWKRFDEVESCKYELGRMHFCFVNDWMSDSGRIFKFILFGVCFGCGLMKVEQLFSRLWSVAGLVILEVTCKFRYFKSGCFETIV